MLDVGKLKKVLGLQILADGIADGIEVGTRLKRALSERGYKRGCVDK